jgi:glycosyltransferase involved in cell wall biosynthesis
MRPRVSVVVPVRDRRDLLRELVEGLAAQTYDDFEVVVVDDGSSDGSAAVAADHPILGPRVRIVRLEGVGAVAARRVGVAVATGDVLAFTDSDCVPDPAWLAAGLAAIDKGADVVQGVTRPARPTTPLERSVTEDREDGLYATCNVFYRRDAFDRAGGFDPEAVRRLGFRVNRRARGLGFGEDTLLAWRVRRTGVAAFAPDAEVHHHVFPPDISDSLSRAFMAGAFPALVADVPELRATLLAHGFLLGTGRVPLYGAVLARFSGRRRLAGLLLGAWIVRHARVCRQHDPSWRALARTLPAVLALDATTAVALALGSARARTTVL